MYLIFIVGICFTDCLFLALCKAASKDIEDIERVNF